MAKMIPIIDTSKYLLFIFRYFEIKGEISRISSSPILFLRDVWTNLNRTIENALIKQNSMKLSDCGISIIRSTTYKFIKNRKMVRDFVLPLNFDDCLS